LNNKRIEISQPVTGEEEWQALRDPIFSGWLTQGIKVAAFEKEFARRAGVRHAIATTSCTTGLHLSLAAMGVGPGDEVIVPTFTWVATANIILHCGATPVFVDVEPETFNLNISQVASSITERTRVVIPVHMFGLCADIDSLRQKTPENIKIVEDAACAAGAVYNNKHAGSLGDTGVFSFHPRKCITTGEGGMITTNDDTLAEKMIQMRNHGAMTSEEERHVGPKPYLLPDFNLLGFNYRMTDLQGAVGLVQLSKLDRFIKERASAAQFYREQLADVDWIHLPEEPQNGSHGWQAFVMTVIEDKAPMSRNEIMEALQEKGISTRPGTHAVHMLHYYRKRFGFKPEDFPIARDCADFSLAIPLHNKMTKEDYSHIVDTIKHL
jgi:perosamine synthetase